MEVWSLFIFFLENYLSITVIILVIVYHEENKQELWYKRNKKKKNVKHLIQVIGRHSSYN